MNLLVSMRYLVALDDHKHFARAAQACFVTQPALSNALRALETEFGAAIVKRSRTFVGFTAEGERLLASARLMLREEALLKQDLSRDTGQLQGKLHIGVVPTAEAMAARFAAQLHVLHPGVTSVVRVMSSPEIEAGLDNLSLDMGLGFTDRVQRSSEGARPTGLALRVLPQYTEQYFLVRRKAEPEAGTSGAHTPAAGSSDQGLQLGQEISWAAAAALPLCLMTPEMHNRRIVDAAFSQAGASVQAALETNSILTLALSTLAGRVCAVMPGALVGAVRAYRELQACPLVNPEIRTPIGFMVLSSGRPSRTLEAAMRLAQDKNWLDIVASHHLFIE
jgi:DNA-binding transcriptional LysR family regulator